MVLQAASKLYQPSNKSGTPQLNQFTKTQRREETRRKTELMRRPLKARLKKPKLMKREIRNILNLKGMPKITEVFPNSCIKLPVFRVSSI